MACSSQPWPTSGASGTKGLKQGWPSLRSLFTKQTTCLRLHATLAVACLANCQTGGTPGKKNKEQQKNQNTFPLSVSGYASISCTFPVTCVNFPAFFCDFKIISLSQESMQFVSERHSEAKGRWSFFLLLALDKNQEDSVTSSTVNHRGDFCSGLLIVITILWMEHSSLPCQVLCLAKCRQKMTDE